MDEQKENKAVEPFENKAATTPVARAVKPRDKKVKVRIKPNRRVEGLGAGGSEHLLYAADAERLVRIGYAEYVEGE